MSNFSEASTTKKLVIIGGSTSGLTAASRARRVNEALDITIVEESENIGYAKPALPALASGIIENFKSQTNFIEEKLIDTYNLRVLKSHKALSINKQEKSISIKNLNTGKTSEIEYDKLILACGSKFMLPKRVDSKFSNVFSLKNVEDALKIKEYIAKTSAKKISFIGANYYSVITINDFIKKGFEITLIEENSKIIEEFDDEFNYFIKKELKNNGVKILTNTKINKLIKNDNSIVSKIELADKSTIETNLIIYFTKIKPNNDLLLKSSFQLTESGRIEIDNNMQANIENVFAIGNIAEIKNTMPKNSSNCMYSCSVHSQARTAGSNAAGLNTLYKERSNSIIIKFDNFTIGKTGLNSNQAKNLGYKPRQMTLFAGNHDRFIPKSEKIQVKIIIDNDSQKVLGAMACSRGDGVDKKLDILSTAIYAGLTTEDLANLDLCYSPELNTPVDLINILGMMSEDRTTELTDSININDIYFDSKICLLDIRSKKEYEKSHIEGSIWIPLNELRSRLDEIPDDKEIYIYSHIGLRGYVAERILKGNGFSNVFNIEGGMTSIKIFEAIN